MFETASDIVRTMLNEYGLDFTRAELKSFLNRMSDDPDEAPIILEEIRQSDQYKTRFAGLQRRIDNGYEPLTPAEYIRMEGLYRQSIRQAGLPMSFYDEPDELAEFIANDVAPDEFESRIMDGVIAAQQAPREVREQMQQFYGVPNVDGALAAYYLDPDKALPAIQREMEASRVAGAAMQTGFGQISQQDAERLGDQGVTFDAASQGFSQMQDDEEVTSQNLGRGREFSRREQMDATFLRNAGLRQAIESQRRQRISEFASQSRANVSQSGLSAFQRTTGAPTP